MFVLGILPPNNESFVDNFLLLFKVYRFHAFHIYRFRDMAILPTLPSFNINVVCYIFVQYFLNAQLVVDI